VAIRLYNTLSRAKEDFAPIDAANVRVYVCGPTVHDFAHIGNGRAFTVFDVLYRLLRSEYGAAHVTYVRNITDVEDKINAAAAERGETIRALTERTTAAFHADMAALGNLPPDIEPRATDHIPRMIAMIATLIAGGFAYEAEGHVLFSIAAMPDYGRLSRKNLDEQREGARVEVAPYKRDAGDFVLWKPSPPALPGWDSPWQNQWGGRGRPGWHIECSAMTEAHLGETFDIHGGGLDLIFPHHENEIAQSVCAHGGAPLGRHAGHQRHRHRREDRVQLVHQLRRPGRPGDDQIADHRRRRQPARRLVARGIDVAHQARAISRLAQNRGHHATDLLVVFYDEDDFSGH